MVAVVAVRPVVTSVVAWTVGAATAIAVGVIALSLIGSGLTAGPIPPLAPNAVTQPAPSSSPTTPAAPATATTSAHPPTHPAPTRTDPPTTSDRTVTTHGGTVIARCRPTGAYLVAWSPAPGYRVDDVQRGPAPTARVTFEGLGHEVKVSIACPGGMPEPTITGEGPGDDYH